MNRALQVSLAQLDLEPLAADANGERVLEIATAEARAGAGLIVFPELCNTGYVEPLAPGQGFPSGSASHTDYSRRLHASAAAPDGGLVQALATLAERYRCHLVAGLALRSATRPGVLYNASLLLGPYGLRTCYAKAHLWHNEKLYFTPGRAFPVSDIGIGRLGMQVCYDIRFPEITRCLALGGAELVTNIWASFRHAEEPVEDEGLFRHRAYTRAQENGVFFLSCNRVGRQGDMRFMGRSLVARPDGRILAALDHEKEGVLRTCLDLDEVATYRMSTGILNDRRPKLYQALIEDESLS
ncbi:carbon-nitrogen hydrolase family protein [Halomonas halocynthiae]|uniref:carbon-nitrogen hydrolase family protein n=1 Tax=Halomonas halocynthiae TaxID=176290 RepID=UPI00041B26AD|nr:carbon-nitrogen hydrolase family protein [Halomonas halocynthiae]